MNEAKPWTPPADSSDGARGPVPTVEELFDRAAFPGPGVKTGNTGIRDRVCEVWTEDRRAIALDAARRALLRAAEVADKDLFSCGGRGRRDRCGPFIAEAIRALAREPERVLEEGE